MVRRVRAGLCCALVAVAAASPAAPVAAAAGDKVLSRVAGSVGYQLDPAAPVKPVFGPVDVPDDAYAVTQSGARALLSLRDSSQIDIGERTTVKVGAFTMPGATQTGNQITIDHGAVKFTIHHPEGTRSNYTFTTPTSQIAVRGTEAYVTVGPNGTQVACTDCAPGDVTVTINGRVLALITGQTLTVLGSSPATATFTVTQGGLPNPSLQQFSRAPQTATSDPTGYQVTSTTSKALPLAVGGAVLGAIVALDHSAPGTPGPSPTPVPYGPLTVSATTLAFDAVPQTKTFTVQQTGPGGSIAIGQPQCGGDGAAASVSPASAQIAPSAGATTISVTAQAAPTQSPPPAHACSLVVTGGNGTSATVFVDVHVTQVGITRHAPPSASPSPTPAPTSAPLPHKPH